MNQDVKKMWVAALRSGDYKQDKQFLRTTKGFCCLGVLCDLYAKVHKHATSVWSIPLHQADNQFYTFGLNAESLPPEDVIAWAGFPNKEQFIDGTLTPDPEVWYGSTKVSLTMLNDGVPETDISAQPFSVIADCIEKSL